MSPEYKIENLFAIDEIISIIISIINKVIDKKNKLLFICFILIIITMRAKLLNKYQDELIYLNK
jgi:hypothetical protein